MSKRNNKKQGIKEGRAWQTAVTASADPWVVVYFSKRNKTTQMDPSGPASWPRIRSRIPKFPGLRVLPGCVRGLPRLFRQPSQPGA
jgi:hypothetical protein